MCDYITDIKRSYPDVRTIDARLLQEPITRDMLTHEPYTPESADSHSPVFSSRRLLGNHGGGGSEGIRRGSVSPEQLKSKLASLVMESLRSSNVNVSLLTAKATNDSSSSDYDMCDESKTPEISTDVDTIQQDVTTPDNVLSKDSSSHIDIARISSSSSNLVDSNQGQFRSRSKSDLPPLKHGKRTNKDVRNRKAKHSLLRDKEGSSSQSLARLQSHHSSSDEDWFEFDLPQERKIKEANLNLTVATSDSKDISGPVKSPELTIDTHRPKEIVKNESRRNCCCIL